MSRDIFNVIFGGYASRSWRLRYESLTLAIQPFLHEAEVREKFKTTQEMSAITSIPSLICRGLSLVHMTTTTMGLFDTAVDNTPLKKNLLGCLASFSERHLVDFVADPLRKFGSAMFRHVYFERMCKNSVKSWCHEL